MKVTKKEYNIQFKKCDLMYKELESIYKKISYYREMKDFVSSPLLKGDYNVIINDLTAIYMEKSKNYTKESIILLSMYF